MAVPKRKTSKAKRNSRGAHYTAATPTLVECKQCKALKASHEVCKSCGYYDGKRVIDVE